MAELYRINKSTLEDLADTVRTATGQTGPISFDQIEAVAKESIIISNGGTSGGGVDTSDATATADEIFAGETAYVAEGKVTGTFTIDSELAEQSDLISQISTLVATKATPSGTDTSDATATAGDILSGKTAYVKGEKITGTIATKTSSNLTASGATVTVPAGYYASQATKSVSSGSAKTPATTITKNPSISVNSSGLITASVSGTQSVTPTVTSGYVSSGTAGTITVSGSATKQLTTKGATTYTPTTSNQTIASGTYLTGTQTIKGDANLVAGNIKSGVSIFGVAGNYEGSGGGGGSTAEVCTVSVICDAPTSGYEMVYYSNGTSTVQEEDFIEFGTTTISVLRNSIIYVNTNVIPSGGVSRINAGVGMYYVTDNGSISVM